MSGFQVDPEELVSLSGQLTRMQQDLAGVGDKLRLDGGSAHGQVVSALSHFAGEWGYALQKISEHAATVAGNLRGAGEAYRKSDDEIAKAASGQGGGGG